MENYNIFNKKDFLSSAINQITGENGEVIRYEIKSVGEGRQ